MVTTAMLTRAILIVPNMGNQMLYVLCVAGYRLQRTVGTNILYLLCSKSQNELNSNSKFYLLLDLFVTCIKHIDM